VPTARLRLKSARRYDDPAMREELAGRFAALGVAPERLVFDRGDLGMAAHLSFYGRIDISLDTTPFNGATTTFESLWMGVPVVALAGRTVMSRWAAAVLARIGRPEWTAGDEAGYAERAAELAAVAAGQDRAGLRARVQASALCDLGRHARDYERLYRALWRRWCARVP
jgi:predicted O-linked N-acetylglucosamine transferase (SPINDLY family)